jgi:hypothetical protein
MFDFLMRAEFTRLLSYKYLFFGFLVNDERIADFFFVLTFACVFELNFLSDGYAINFIFMDCSFFISH